jgi:hypothetical protein
MVLTARTTQYRVKLANDGHTESSIVPMWLVLVGVVHGLGCGYLEE